MKSFANWTLLALVVLASSQDVGAQDQTVLEVDLLSYRAEYVPQEPFVCPNGAEIPTGSLKWYLYEANVDGVISGEFDQQQIAFASSMALNFQCVLVYELPAGSMGERLRELGAMYQASAAICGDFRPRLEGGVRFWDGWYLNLDEPKRPPQEPREPNIGLIDRFLEGGEFALFELLDDLPQDVQSLLPRWNDGTFSMAEKGESWNQIDVHDVCNPRKTTQHFLSGISDGLAVIFYRSGGIAVFGNVWLLDRSTGDGLTCRVDETAMRGWNGSNQLISMFATKALDPSTLDCR